MVFDTLEAHLTIRETFGRGSRLCATAVAVPGTDGASSTASRRPACCQGPQKDISLRVGKTGCFQGKES